MYLPVQIKFINMKSETIKALKDLFDILPSRRYRDLSLVVAFSIVQGLMDVLLVALLARLVGLIAGAQLTDQLPGFKYSEEIFLIRLAG